MGICLTKMQKTVFNSNMSLNYLFEYTRTQKPAKDLIDASIASDYFKLGKLFTLKNKSSNYEVLQSMSNRDSIKLDEKHVKTVCFTLCMLSNCYVVESENEANKGYCDIQLTKRPGIDVNYYAIIEFKYLSKEEGNESNELLS